MLIEFWGEISIHQPHCREYIICCATQEILGYFNTMTQPLFLVRELFVSFNYAYI